jgi:hypothetical protein
MNLLENDIKQIIDSIIPPPPILVLKKSWSPDTFYVNLRDRPKFSTFIPGLSQFVEPSVMADFTRHDIRVRKSTPRQIAESITRSMEYDLEVFVRHAIAAKKRKTDPLLNWLSRNLYSSLRNSSTFHDEMYSVWKWLKSDTFTKDDDKNAIELIRLIAKKQGAHV